VYKGTPFFKNGWYKGVLLTDNGASLNFTMAYNVQKDEVYMVSLWHGRCWALQNECDGGRDALVRMPTPPQHVDEDFSSIGVKVMWWRDEQSKI
ncbi:MAG: hypothetical protein J0651_05110, partial [Actinobacteria bacterium]|nr:hypothetical protein [Actinomycetota bacterium]